MFSSTKVILSAGLGAAQLGPKMGFKAPVRPQRGQVLITEKLPKIINRPSLIARQVDEGGIQIGATNEEVGLDDDVTQPGLSGLAAEADRRLSGSGQGATRPQLGRVARAVARRTADLSGKRGDARRLSRDLPQRHHPCRGPCACSCRTGWRARQTPRIWRCSVKPVSPFLDLDEDTRASAVWFDGAELRLPEGANLAAALLAAGVVHVSPYAGLGRTAGPFCMMGACFDCLVEIDGVTRQACMIEVSEGLRLTCPAQPSEPADANL